MRMSLLLICCVLLLPVVDAATFTLQDASTGKNLTDVFVDVGLVSPQERLQRTAYIPEQGKLEVDIPLGDWELTFLIDNLKTPGKDYVARRSFHAPSAAERLIFAFPAGSIRGSVLDKYDNLVPDALLQFQCQAEYGGIPPSKTDSFGGFSYLYVPLGECVVSATYGSAAGSSNIVIEQGLSKEVDVKLDQGVAKKTSNLWYYWVAALILLFFIYYFVQKIKKGKKFEKVAAKATEIVTVATPELSRRQHDVLQTLRDVEKEIVRFVLQQGGSTTQSKIYYGTGIPKTSLSRALQSLTVKNILKITPFGKMKRVEFSDWFKQK
ncbi:hypothetical protein J4457_01505 [Candidatus Woesearchaeota archaeon]|nr:hypothetical protein [Candidatus Woesearchaeota archaeon]